MHTHTTTFFLITLYMHRIIFSFSAFWGLSFICCMILLKHLVQSCFILYIENNIGSQSFKMYSYLFGKLIITSSIHFLPFTNASLFNTFLIFHSISHNNNKEINLLLLKVVTLKMKELLNQAGSNREKETIQ